MGKRINNKKAPAKAAPITNSNSEESVSTSNGEKVDSALESLLKSITITCSVENTASHHRSRDILVENVSLLYHGRHLLKETTLALSYGRRYGLLGFNGCGKSTLMTAMANRLVPIPSWIDIFHLASEIEASEMTALEAVLSVDAERQILEKEANKLSELMSSEDLPTEEADIISAQLVDIYDQLDAMESATAESRAAEILCGLGFTPQMQKKKTREFSGGWRMRIALARALFIKPTLLLLDEPTNHLDMEAVVWLEEYLKGFNKTLLLISHSQDFLNNVCTNIIHMQAGQLVYYTGNYNQFLKTRSEKEENQMKRYNWEQDQIKHMKDYIARFGHGSAKLARQAQSKEKVLAKMERDGLTEKVFKERTLEFYFPDPEPFSPPVLQFVDVAFGYPGQKNLYERVDLGVDLDSRVALVGPNGAGKTTLLKLMAGELSPTNGMVRPHSKLRMARFTQHFIDTLDMNLTPLQYMMQEYPGIHDQEMCQFLGRFGITGAVHNQKIDHLSDGQKSRVVFAWMAHQGAHVLLLDEPTNHLDIETIDSLAEAINEFGGGVVLVSHDMRLIDRVATEIWLCNEGRVNPYKGTIEDYKKELRKQMNLD